MATIPKAVEVNGTIITNKPIAKRAVHASTSSARTALFAYINWDLRVLQQLGGYEMLSIRLTTSIDANSKPCL